MSGAYLCYLPVLCLAAGRSICNAESALVLLLAGSILRFLISIDGPCCLGAMAASLDLGDDDSEPMPAAPCSEGSGDEELSGNCSQETVEYIDDWGEAERECEALPGDPVPPGPLLAASFVYHGIYFAGARELMPSEIDLKFEFLDLDIYLIRGVRVAELAYPSGDPAELLAFSMVSHGQVRWSQMLRLVQLLPRDKNMRWSQDDTHAVPPRRFTIGAYNQSPMDGTTLTVRSFPWTACVLSGIVSMWDDTLGFSTCTLSLNVSAKPHKDGFNHLDSRNLVMPLSRFVSGGLFAASADGRTSLCANGQSGHIIDLFTPVSLSPRALHASMPWSGTRLLLIAYHIGQSHRLSDGAESLRGLWNA